MTDNTKTHEVLEIVTQANVGLEKLLRNMFGGWDLRAIGSSRTVRIASDDERVSVFLFDTNEVLYGSAHFDGMPAAVIAAAVLRLLEED